MSVKPAVITALWQWDETCPRKFNFDYTFEHAQRWVAGVRRCMSVPHRTIILVDEHWHGRASVAFDGSVELVRIDPELTILGMSPNMQCYHPDLGVGQGMMAGLDTIFVGDITDIVTWNGAPIGLPVDPRDPFDVCNGVNVFTREGGDLIWSTYQENLLDKEPDTDDRRWFKRFGPRKLWRFADMHLIRHLWRESDWPTLDQTFPGRIASYKVQVRHGLVDPDHLAIVYLHGNPRLGELPEDDPIQKEWLRDD